MHLRYRKKNEKVEAFQFNSDSFTLTLDIQHMLAGFTVALITDCWTGVVTLSVKNGNSQQLLVENDEYFVYEPWVNRMLKMTAKLFHENYESDT